MFGSSNMWRSGLSDVVEEQRPSVAPPVPQGSSPVWIACRAAVLLLPLGGVPVSGIPLNVLVIVFVIPVGAALLHVLRGGRPVISAPATGLLLLFGAALIASVFGSDDLSRALELVFVTFAGIGFTVALTFCVDSRDRIRVLCGDLVLALSVCAVWAIVTMPDLAGRFGGGAIDGRATGPFSQPNELGIACAAGLPMALVLLCHAEKRTRLLLAGFEMLLLALALTLSFSRGGWIAAVLGCVAVVVVLPSARRTVAVLVLVGIATVVYVSALSSSPRPAGQMPTTGLVMERLGSIGQVSENPGDHRAEIWEESLRQMDEHPVLGTGPEGFRRNAESGGGPLANIRPPHPHNIFFSYLNEIGLLGVIPLSLFIGRALGNVGRIARSARSGSSASAAAAVLFMPLVGLSVMLFHGLVDNPLANPMIAYTWWTLLGLAGLGIPLLRSRGGAGGARA